jgi:glycosyltransferase involved in cell wall biosynthesis
MRSVSVVVPVYRSAETLWELHRRITASLVARAATFEIIFVDDACPAGSGSVLAELQARDPRVRVLSHSRNFGQQRSLLDGIAAAGGEAVVLMDADLQDPPEAIRALLDKLATGRWSAVFAGRRGVYQSRLRMWTSRLYKRAISRLSGLPPDAGGFVAISRETVDRILGFRVRRPYATVMIAAAGGPLLSIPVVRDLRPAGTSAYSGSMRLRVALRAMRLAVELHRQCSNTNSTTKYSGTTTAAH